MPIIDSNSSTAMEDHNHDAESVKPVVDDPQGPASIDDGEALFELEKVKSRRHLAIELEEIFPDFRVYLVKSEFPINWSLKKRLCHTIAYGLTTFTAQFGATMLSPNAEALSEQFHVGLEVTTLVFSIYVIGQCVGPLFFAPLSEVQGRKIGVFVPCFIAGVWLCVAANASNVWSLMVFRFLAGVFSSAPIVSSGGALADLWSPSSRASALVLYALCIVSATSSGPTFGALLDITGSYGWRWSCWLSGLLQLVIPLANLAFLSESYVPVLESRKARKLRIKTKIWQLHADLDLWSLTFNEFIRVHCLRPILMFLTPVLFVLVIYTAFVYGLLFICITSVALEFQAYHHFSFVASYVPLCAIFVGFMFGGAVNVLNSHRYARKKKMTGSVVPEDRLPAMMLFGWTLPCGLFIYGFCMQYHWILPTIGLALLGCGIAVIFQGSLVYIVDCYTKFAASGIAANTFLRSLFGGVFPLFARQMYDAMGVRWASALLGFVGIALWPFTWFFFLYGARLRQIEPYGKLLH